MRLSVAVRNANVREGAATRGREPLLEVGVPVAISVTRPMSWLKSRVPDMSYQAGRPLRVDGEVRLPPVEATGEWVEAGRAEYASVATFARLSLELMALGAPASLVRRAHQAALDEIRHAETCFALAGREVRLGPLVGADGPIRATAVGVALTSLVDGCLGEGFAAVMLEARAAGDPALAQMAEDERRHAELAWAVLAWAVEAGGPRVEAARCWDSYRCCPPGPTSGGRRCAGTWWRGQESWSSAHLWRADDMNHETVDAGHARPARAVRIHPAKRAITHTRLGVRVTRPGS